MQSNNARERDVERRLGRVDSPEPPADLLARIRADLPEYLRPADETGAQGPTGRGRFRLAAASVLLVIAGGFLAYQVLRQAPGPMGSAAAKRRPDAAAVTPPTPTTEVGVAQVPVATDDGAGRRAAGPRYTAPELAESPEPAEAMAQQEVPRPSSEYPTAPAGEPEPALAAAAEVGLHASPGDEREQEIVVAAPQRHKRSAMTAPTAEDLQRLRGYVGEVAPGAASRPVPPTSVPVRVGGITAAKPILRPDRGAGPSTGGTAEPNDQPWGDMFFRPYGTNPFVDTEDDAQSTFGLDVDTGSYTLARGYLDRGQLPPPEAIRVEEFVNFFDYRDPAPRRGEFTLTAEGAPSPWSRGPRYQLLRVGLHGREISAADRMDATLIFVVDVSGSMARDDRIGLVKRALHLLLDQLGSGDRVGLVVYGSAGRVLLEPSGDLQSVRRAIDRLSTGGSTNAEEGLQLGYELARRHFRPESVNRLVLCSDGVANVGRTGPESILARIGREAEEGIELTTVGFGMGNYNDVLMEQLADQGDGNYAYVDTLDEARRIFVENLTGTLQTIASDAKIQVEFDPRVVSRYRLLGYENRDVADHRFRDDTVDAGEIGAGHQVTALYEIKLAEDAPRRRALAEIRLRYRSKATGQVVEDSLEVRRNQLADSWRGASPSLRLATLAAELAEVLKHSYWARETRPEELRQRALAVESELGRDRDVAELVRLTERAIALVEWPEETPE